MHKRCAYNEVECGNNSNRRVLYQLRFIEQMLAKPWFMCNDKVHTEKGAFTTKNGIGLCNLTVWRYRLHEKWDESALLLFLFVELWLVHSRNAWCDIESDDMNVIVEELKKTTYWINLKKSLNYKHLTKAVSYEIYFFRFLYAIVLDYVTYVLYVLRFHLLIFLYVYLLIMRLCVLCLFVRFQICFIFFI